MSADIPQELTSALEERKESLSGFLKFPQATLVADFFYFYFSCAKISLSVYFLLGQHTGVSWSSSFTITSPSKIEALSGFVEGLSSL